MNDSNRVQWNHSKALLTALAGLLLATDAAAVDLRDWGRKFPTSERFVVLAQFSNEAVLDKETQLVWQRSPSNSLVPYQAAWDTCDLVKSGGRMGWRLPTLPELRSLMDPAVANNYLPSLPAGHPFIGVMTHLGAGPSGNNYGRYWTTTLTITQDPTYRLVTTISSIHHPTTHTLGTALSAAWCVRGPGQ